MRNRAQFSLVDMPDIVSPKIATSGTDEEANLLYGITGRQEQENSLDIVTGMIKVFAYDVYDLLDPCASLSFVTPYVSMRFDIIPEKRFEPFHVSTLFVSIF